MVVKLETVIAQDAAGYAEAIQGAVKTAGGDGAKLQELIDGINTSRVKAATEKVAADTAKAAKESEANQGRIESLRKNVEATVVKAWTDGKLAEQLAAIPVAVVKHLTIRIERDAEKGTVNAPVVLFGEPVKARKASTSNGGGPRAATLTVDGKEYESAAEAKRALLPNKADASMSRSAIISALKTGSHTVSE